MTRRPKKKAVPPRTHQNLVCFPYGFVWKWLVPLKPMVLLIIIPMKNGYFIGNIPYFQTNPCMFLLHFTKFYPFLGTFFPCPSRRTSPAPGALPWIAPAKCGDPRCPGEFLRILQRMEARFAHLQGPPGVEWMVGHHHWKWSHPPFFREFFGVWNILKLLEMVKKYEETPDFRICLLTYVRSVRRNMLSEMVSLTRKSCTILPARVLIRGGSTALRQNRLGFFCTVASDGSQAPSFPRSHGPPGMFVFLAHHFTTSHVWFHFFPIPIGSMYGIYTNIGGILMVNVTIYTIHGSYGIYN